MSKRMSILLVLFLFLSCFGIILFTNQPPVDPFRKMIDELNDEIAAAGLRWEAGVTSMTRLDPASRYIRLGANEPIFEDEIENLYESADLEAPNSLDWRDKDGKNWMTPIKDQGSCGSCFIFGTLAAAEAVYKVEKGKADINPDFSEQHILSCAYAGNCDDGGSPAKVLNYLKSTGVPPEYCFPYKASDLGCNPCNNWKQRKANIKGWSSVTLSRARQSSIISALQKGPVVGRFDVYSDFSNYKSGIYEKTPSATYEGGHCISIVGYNKSQGYWICKNSWGTDWGEKGYFRIAFGEVEIGTYVRKINGVSIRNKRPAMDPVGNKTIEEGELISFKIKARDPDNDPLEFSSPKLPEGAEIDKTSGQFNWTPAYDQSGNYRTTFTVCDGILKVSRTITIEVKDVPIKIGKGKF